MPDQVIQCCDCPDTFTFTEGEQAYYAAQKPQPFSTPRRCKACRAKKKRNNEERATREAMGNAPPPLPDENEHKRDKENKPQRKEKGHW